MPKNILSLILILLGMPLIAGAQEPLAEEQPLVVRFSIAGGFYRGPVQLMLDAGSASVYYTTDGSEPTSRSTRYTRPIPIKETTVIRAMARRRKISGRPFTQTYFIREPATDLPVVSVTMDPRVLFHRQKGIMVIGPDADSGAVHKPGANFWTRQEFACNVEIFESDKRCVHNSGSGMRLFGGYSRIYPQKSMVLVARSRYGKKFFRHRIFGADQPKKYKYLVLRNGGSDFDGAHFRDELMNRLTDGWDLEKQAFRPALVYLNGRYWGIYHIREKINARFLKDHMDVDRDSLDLLEHRQSVRHGSGKYYQRMLRYIEKHDLSDPTHYNWVQSQMDVQNFIDYQVAQIYCDNTDAGGNIRYWRARRPGGRWRWIMFDTDWGFGLYDPQAWQHDAIAFFTEPNGPRWPNPPWSTFLFRKLLQNKDFREQFINRLCDRLNTSLAPQQVLTQINWFEQLLAPGMPRHLERWKQSETVWHQHLALLREFAVKRPGFLRDCVAQHFQVGGRAGLEVEAGPGGSVLINQCITVESDLFSGTYFENVPVTLFAKPAFGYRFAGWEGIDRQGRAIHTYLQAGRTLHIRARFEPHVHPLNDLVFINEINPAGGKTGDWVELYNASGEGIPLVGWSLTDNRHDWRLPSVTIPPHSYLVLCQDSAAFRRKFPQIPLVVGDFRFGLNKHAERLALYASDGAAIDSIAYHLDPPEGDFTLDLLMPKLDNANPKNWAVHLGPGSPGDPNPLYWSKVVLERKDRS
ncbi:MAG: hypothetical protein EP344_15950, partial [Bacteroidetes bacterium]